MTQLTRKTPNLFILMQIKERLIIHALKQAGLKKVAQMLKIQGW